VRDYGRDWGLPRYWLAQRTLDPEWLSELQDVLKREAEKIAQRGGQKFIGERLSLGRIQGQPHYYLITWQKAARGQEKEGAGENNRIATRTEAWAKAIFAAAIIHGLTGCQGRGEKSSKCRNKKSTFCRLKSPLTNDGRSRHGHLLFKQLCLRLWRAAQ